MAQRSQQARTSARSTAHGRFRIVIADADFPSIEPEQEELAGLGSIVRYSCANEEDVVRVAHDADAIIVQYAPITDFVIEQLSRCRVIGRYGVGLDTIDLEAAARRGIPVVNVPDYCVEEVSDHAVALMLAWERRIVTLCEAVRGGAWDCSGSGSIRRMRDVVVGMLGLGRIGLRVAEKLRPFGSTLIACDPYADRDDLESVGIELVDFAALLSRSDILSIHCPLTAATHHIIGSDALRAMTRTSLLVNTSRGKIVDEHALVAALDDGEIAAAALDVLEDEPCRPDNPLLARSNVILTPHAGFYSDGSMTILQRRTARAVADVLRGAGRGNARNGGT